MTFAKGFDALLQEALDCLSKHELREVIPDVHYVMRRPDSNVYHVNVVSAGRRVGLHGDIMMGARGNGIWSSLGYGVHWFREHNGPDYLCSKFLGQNFNSEAFVDRFLEHLVDMDAEDRQKAEAWLLRGENAQLGLERLDHDGLLDCIESKWKLHAIMGQFDLCGDGFGMVYPTGDAAWLVAVQQTFRRLST